MSETSFPTGTKAGWRKSPSNPIIGGEHGTCFDPTVLLDEGLYRMYFSWRPKHTIGLVESQDGIHWNEPRIVVDPDPAAKTWEDINRQIVVKRDGVYHMWLSIQSPDRSGKAHAWITHAVSGDGYVWRREPSSPVLTGEAEWEKQGVMCPHVLWDEERGLYRMWYSGMSDGGKMYEPDAIGYAESPDGVKWTKAGDGPVFKASGVESDCDGLKVTACQVIKKDGWHYMFYIGFQTHERATICLARSRDGIGGWERHPANPIVAPDDGAWDHDACYKPYAIFDGRQWRLWYNGRRGHLEQIGLVAKDSEDLGF